MSGFLLIYDTDIVILNSDSFLDTLAKKSGQLNRGGNVLLEMIFGNFYKVVYISDKDTYKKISDLNEAKEYKLISQLYHTLQNEESIIERNRRLEELNNIYKSDKGESIEE